MNTQQYITKQHSTTRNVKLVLLGLALTVVISALAFLTFYEIHLAAARLAKRQTEQPKPVEVTTYKPILPPETLKREPYDDPELSNPKQALLFRRALIEQHMDHVLWPEEHPEKFSLLVDSTQNIINCEQTIKKCKKEKAPEFITNQFRDMLKGLQENLQTAEEQVYWQIDEIEDVPYGYKLRGCIVAGNKQYKPQEWLCLMDIVKRNGRWKLLRNPSLIYYDPETKQTSEYIAHWKDGEDNSIEQLESED